METGMVFQMASAGCQPDLAIKVITGETGPAEHRFNWLSDRLKLFLLANK